MKTTRNLTREEIESIPRLKREGYTTRAIARLFDVHQTSVNYWIRRLEEAGHENLRDNMGRPKLKLRDENFSGNEENKKVENN